MIFFARNELLFSGMNVCNQSPYEGLLSLLSGQPP